MTARSRRHRLVTPPAAPAATARSDALRRDYPRLIVVAIRLLGAVSRAARLTASDIELMAAGGAMARGRAGRLPVRVSEPQSYGWAGAQAAIGALVALFRRDAGRATSSASRRRLR
jgi:crotonobetainyl-CoA:carnitine CoA-transferase CaiB-like acyl-CoA transferase